MPPFPVLWQQDEGSGVCRVVLAGDAGVGKSSLIMRLVKNSFVNNLPSTLGVDFHVKSLNVDNKNVAIQLWDTAGQERLAHLPHFVPLEKGWVVRFRSMCKNYFRRADGAFLVYDVTSEFSFLAVRDWMQTLQESVQKRVPIILCGNKADARLRMTSMTAVMMSRRCRTEAVAEGRRCVSEEEGRGVAKAHQALFMETSAKCGTNVQAAILEMARELLASEDIEVPLLPLLAPLPRRPQPS